MGGCMVALKCAFSDYSSPLSQYTNDDETLSEKAHFKATIHPLSKRASDMVWSCLSSLRSSSFRAFSELSTTQASSPRPRLAAAGPPQVSPPLIHLKSPSLIQLFC